jgi:pSer/pThr/pTyr-binding forkhead associated (FHA) protein
MDCKLKVLDGKHAGQEVAVSGDKFFIGRAEDCQIRPGSDLISRHHCVLIVDENYVGVRDLGSKNGTFVNAEQVVGERELKAGDRLKVGPLEFEILLQAGVIGGKKRPPVTGGVREAATRAATNTTTAGDLDLDGWLAPEPAQATQPGPHDTQKTKIAVAYDTEEIDIGGTKELASEVVTDSSATDVKAKAAEETQLDAKGKKVPAKSPFSPSKIMGKDSRDAAAQVLEMMKKKR